MLAIYWKCLRPIKSRAKKENGFTLVDTIVALAIFTTAGLALTSGLVTATSTASLHRDRVTGEILARGEMEYVMKQPYSSNPWSCNVTASQRLSTQQPSWWDDSNPPLLAEEYTGYVVSTSEADFDADGDGVIEVPGDDSDIRRITVRVYRPETKLLVTLESNKANR